jgi:hypothetical protein
MGLIFYTISSSPSLTMQIITPDTSERSVLYSVDEVKLIAKTCGYKFHIELPGPANKHASEPYSLFDNKGILIFSWHRYDQTTRDKDKKLIHSGVYHDNFFEYVVRYCKNYRIDTEDTTVATNEEPMNKSNYTDPNFFLARATVSAVIDGIELAHKATGSSLRFDYSAHPDIGRLIADKVATILDLDQFQYQILEALGHMNQESLVLNEDEVYIDWISRAAAAALNGTLKF